MLFLRFSAEEHDGTGGLEEIGGGLLDPSDAATSKSGSGDAGDDSPLLKQEKKTVKKESLPWGAKNLVVHTFDF